MIDFPGRLEFFREDSLGFTEVDEDIPIPLPLIVTDDHLSDPFFELRVQGVSLDLPQCLFGLLLGALNRAAVELLRADLDQQLIPYFALLGVLYGICE